MYAVIATGGKQYKVESGQVLDVERLGAEDGEVELRPVLLVDGDVRARDAGPARWRHRDRQGRG